MGKSDYYAILGVPRNAGDEDFKKAYKKLAIKFHPDKNHAPGASEAFKKVAKAYSCLTDPAKRRIYD
jgi:DnaJ-class molecular chaperone|tara:strand:+ start:79 stop:279 length:201 start_codon:yes stop_codon:yes gene_type:complete